MDKELEKYLAAGVAQGDDEDEIRQLYWDRQAVIREVEALRRDNAALKEDDRAGRRTAKDLIRENERLRDEVAAYRKAKQENDERFQIAAAEQRERAEAAEARLGKLRVGVAGGMSRVGLLRIIDA